MLGSTGTDVEVVLGGSAIVVVLGCEVVGSTAAVVELGEVLDRSASDPPPHAATRTSTQVRQVTIALGFTLGYAGLTRHKIREPHDHQGTTSPTDSDERFLG